MQNYSDAIKGKQEQHLQENQFSCLLSLEFLILIIFPCNNPSH